MGQVIEVLRMPIAPNALYHAACYQPDQRAVVLQVLELRGTGRCARCQRLLFPPVAQHQIIRQLDLWSSVA